MLKNHSKQPNRLQHFKACQERGMTLLSSVFGITLLAIIASFSFSQFLEVKHSAQTLVNEQTSLKTIANTRRFQALNTQHIQKFQKYIVEENGRLYMKIPVSDLNQ